MIQIIPFNYHILVCLDGLPKLPCTLFLECTSPLSLMYWGQCFTNDLYYAFNAYSLGDLQILVLSPMQGKISSFFSDMRQ